MRSEPDSSEVHRQGGRPRRPPRGEAQPSVVHRASVSEVQPVFVGDVQGCADELDELIERLDTRFGNDWTLHLAGDLVNRGPDNLRVLARVRSLCEAGRARSVLGNHELGLFATHFGLRTQRYADTYDDVLASSELDAWLAWLRGLPLVETGRFGDVPWALVHAATHPDWSLGELEQHARRAEARLREGDLEALRRFLALAPEDDPDRDALALITNCRSVTPRGAWSKEEPVRPAQPWHVAWRARGHDFGVIYGHWSLQGLHVAPRLRGLDTGCVHHGRDHEGFLTAWVPSLARSDPFAIPDDGFVQVRARARYYRDASSATG